MNLDEIFKSFFEKKPYFDGTILVGYDDFLSRVVIAEVRYSYFHAGGNIVIKWYTKENVLRLDFNQYTTIGGNTKNTVLFLKKFFEYAERYLKTERKIDADMTLDGLVLLKISGYKTYFIFADVTKEPMEIDLGNNVKLIVRLKRFETLSESDYKEISEMLDKLTVLEDDISEIELRISPEKFERRYGIDLDNVHKRFRIIRETIRLTPGGGLYTGGLSSAEAVKRKLRKEIEYAEKILQMLKEELARVELGIEDADI